MALQQELLRSAITSGSTTGTTAESNRNYCGVISVMTLQQELLRSATGTTVEEQGVPLVFSLCPDPQPPPLTNSPPLEAAQLPGG